MNTNAYEYTPYTSESLDTGNVVIDNITAFTGIDNAIPSLPTGKQVIFFSIGLLCIVTSLTLMTRSLIDVPSIASIAKLAA